MQEPDWAAVLAEACRQASAYLAGLPDRPVGPRAGAAELRKALGGSLPESPDDAREVSPR
jgi:hypothetical protein